MPTYVYKFVETDETIEIQQSFADDTLTEAVHPESGKTMAVKKVFLPVGVTFKGDGFYKTDSRASSKKKKPSSTSSESSGSSGSSDSSSSGTSGASDSKSASSGKSDSGKSDSGSSSSTGKPSSSSD